MMTMRARKPIENYIPGRTVRVGELFDAASLGDAQYLALADLAEYVDDEPPKKKSKYKTREMRAEDE